MISMLMQGLCPFQRDIPTYRQQIQASSLMVVGLFYRSDALSLPGQVHITDALLCQLNFLLQLCKKQVSTCSPLQDQAASSYTKQKAPSRAQYHLPYHSLSSPTLLNVSVKTHPTPSITPDSKFPRIDHFHDIKQSCPYICQLYSYIKHKFLEGACELTFNLI